MPDVCLKVRQRHMKTKYYSNNTYTHTKYRNMSYFYRQTNRQTENSKPEATLILRGLSGKRANKVKELYVL